MSSPDRIDPALAADIDRLATTLAKDPRSKAFMPLAEAYIRAGMWQEAAAVLEDGLKVYPGFITAMAALGRVYDQVGQPAKAKAILEEVVRQSPDNLRAHRILAKIYAGERNAGATLKSCGAILAVNPHDEEALSIQRSMAGRRTGETVVAEDRLGEESAPASTPASDSVQDAGVPSESSVTAELEPTDQAARSEEAAPKAAALLRLQTWLQTIQLRRQGHLR
jgi:tetratricopeptide (TPR) repeat protein